MEINGYETIFVLIILKDVVELTQIRLFTLLWAMPAFVIFVAIFWKKLKNIHLITKSFPNKSFYNKQ